MAEQKWVVEEAQHSYGLWFVCKLRDDGMVETFDEPIVRHGQTTIYYDNAIVAQARADQLNEGEGK